jgi:hypothetical protein
MYRFLAQRGFSSNLVQRAIKNGLLKIIFNKVGMPDQESFCELSEPFAAVLEFRRFAAPQERLLP